MEALGNPFTFILVKLKVGKRGLIGCLYNYFFYSVDVINTKKKTSKDEE